MARRRSGKRGGDAGVTPNGGATTGYEAELWSMADALRGSMDAAESSSQSGEGEIRKDASIAENLKTLGFGGDE